MCDLQWNAIKRSNLTSQFSTHIYSLFLIFVFRHKELIALGFEHGQKIFTQEWSEEFWIQLRSQLNKAMMSRSADRNGLKADVIRPLVVTSNFFQLIFLHSVIQSMSHSLIFLNS